MCSMSVLVTDELHAHVVLHLQISKAKSTLEAQNRSTWSSMCQTLVMLLFVTAVFLVVYFIIRVTPKP